MAMDEVSITHMCRAGQVCASKLAGDNWKDSSFNVTSFTISSIFLPACLPACLPALTWHERYTDLSVGGRTGIVIADSCYLFISFSKCWLLQYLHNYNSDSDALALSIVHSIICLSTVLYLLKYLFLILFSPLTNLLNSPRQHHHDSALTHHTPTHTHTPSTHPSPLTHPIHGAMMRASCSSSSCCCSLRSRLMAQTQGIRCGNGSLRGLASSSSSATASSSPSSHTLRTASEWARVHPVAAALPGGGDNNSTTPTTCSGETLPVPLHVPPQQRRPNIIVSPILSQLPPTASSYSIATKSSLLSEKWFASTAAYMSPSLANPLVVSPTPIRPFSTMGNSRFSSSAPVLNGSATSAATAATATTTAVPAAAATPQQQKFTYHISASFAAKQKRFSPTTNIFNFNPYNRVQDSARRKSRPDAGQDAFFVSRINDSGAVAAGVADGVGGYAESGIDSADFSHTFCERMATAAHQATTESVSAKQLIESGYRRILDEDAIAGGASTACVGIAKPDGQLNVANLGDSGFLIIRQGKIHYASAPQTHDFNTPYQLAMIPKKLLAQARQFGGGPFSDEPADAQVSTHSLRNGDVVVFATDGVWDNLSIQDVLRIVTDEMQVGKGWANNGDVGIIPAPNLEGVAAETDGRGIQAQVARAIATRAKSASVSTKLDGPFAKEVQRLFPGENFHGGKKDDICVVCMVVVETKGSTAPKL